MSNQTDICCLPVINGFRLEVAGVLCWAIHRPSPEGSLWLIRGPGGKVLGAGRSCAVAKRIAAMTLEGER